MKIGVLGTGQVGDLGDITGARATESYLHLWIRRWGSIGNANLDVKIVRP